MKMSAKKTIVEKSVHPCGKYDCVILYENYDCVIIFINPLPYKEYRYYRDDDFIRHEESTNPTLGDMGASDKIGKKDDRLSTN